MRKVFLDPKTATYFQKVLGVSHLMIPKDLSLSEDQSIEYVLKSSSAKYIVLADSLDEAVASEINEMLLKLSSALGPEGVCQLILLKPNWSASKALRQLEADLRRTERVLCLGSESRKLMSDLSKDLLNHQMNTFFKQRIACSYSPKELLEDASFKKATWGLMQMLMKS